jgi:hypothetical protein
MRQTVLDNSKEDRARFDHLLKDADVFFANRRPGCLEAYAVSCRERKMVEMLFAHLKRILRLDRLRFAWAEWSQRWVPAGRHRSKPLKAGEAHSAPDAIFAT